MNYCLFCKKETTNPKYCSHTCRSQVTSYQLKGKNNCKNCGVAIRWNKTYCSEICNLQVKTTKYEAKLVDGTAGDRFLKNHLLKTIGKCMDANCAWDWSKRTAPLEMDHIDGKASNNVISNVRLLCPNCHSLTSTYKGKNKGNSTRAFRRK